MSAKEREDQLNREIEATEQWYNEMFKEIYKNEKDILDNFKIIVEKES